MLDDLVRREANAKQRDRYRAVLPAMTTDDDPERGRELEGDDIASRLATPPPGAQPNRRRNARRNQA